MQKTVQSLLGHSGVFGFSMDCWHHSLKAIMLSIKTDGHLLDLFQGFVFDSTLADQCFHTALYIQSKRHTVQKLEEKSYTDFI